jgi:hypothetical protein
MRQYIALIHKEADSDYGVSFPTFLASSPLEAIWMKPGAWQPKPWLFIFKA